MKHWLLETTTDGSRIVMAVDADDVPMRVTRQIQYDGHWSNDIVIELPRETQKPCPAETLRCEGWREIASAEVE